MLRTRASRVALPAVLVAGIAFLACASVAAFGSRNYAAAALGVSGIGLYSVLLVRQHRVGVQLNLDGLVLQRTIRTTTVSWMDIVDVRTVPYLLFWTRGLVVKSDGNIATRRVMLPGILTVAARRMDPPELQAIKTAFESETGRTLSNLDSTSMRSLAFGGRVLIALGLGLLVVVATWNSDWGSSRPTLIMGSGLLASGVLAYTWRHRAGWRPSRRVQR